MTLVTGSASITGAGSAESLVLRLCGFSQARAFPPANAKGRIQAGSAKLGAQRTTRRLETRETSTSSIVLTIKKPRSHSARSGITPRYFGLLVQELSHRIMARYENVFDAVP